MRALKTNPSSWRASTADPSAETTDGRTDSDRPWLDHAARRLLPYGVARSLSLAGPYLLQALFWHAAGAEAAGRFFFLVSAAMFLVLLADLGTSNAFPVLWGSRPGRAVPELGDVLTLRQIVALGSLGVLGAMVAAGLWQPIAPIDVALLGVFVGSRTALTARQGRLYAFQRFGLLARGALWHAIGLLTVLIGAGAMAGVTPTVGLLALIGGNLSELWAMARAGMLWWGGDLPPPPPGSWSARARQAARRLAPYAVAGAAAAVYQRSDALIGDLFLDRETLGLFGTLDACYRLTSAPVFLSGQAIYPALRAAHEAGRPSQSRAMLTHHLRTGGLLALAGMAAFAILTGRSPLGKASPVASTAIAKGSLGSAATAWLWWPFLLAIPVAMFTALMAPLYFSRGQAARLAKVAAISGLVRPLSGALATALLGPAGLALNNLALEAGQAVLTLVVLPRWFPAATGAPPPPPAADQAKARL